MMSPWFQPDTEPITIVVLVGVAPPARDEKPPESCSIATQARRALVENTIVHWPVVLLGPIFTLPAVLVEPLMMLVPGVQWSQV